MSQARQADRRERRTDRVTAIRSAGIGKSFRRRSSFGGRGAGSTHANRDARGACAATCASPTEARTLRILRARRLRVGRRHGLPARHPQAVDPQRERNGGQGGDGGRVARMEADEENRRRACDGERVHGEDDRWPTRARRRLGRYRRDADFGVIGTLALGALGPVGLAGGATGLVGLNSGLPFALRSGLLLALGSGLPPALRLTRRLRGSGRSGSGNAARACSWRTATERS